MCRGCGVGVFVVLFDAERAVVWREYQFYDVGCGYRGDCYFDFWRGVLQVEYYVEVVGGVFVECGL